MCSLNYNELIGLYNKPLDELLARAEEFTTSNIEFCSLVSAKTGKCSQNCKYCAQSSHYLTDIFSHPLISTKDVTRAAQEAKTNMANRFAIVTSGKSPDSEDFPAMLEMIEAINSIEGLTSCASLGVLTEEQVIALKEAGLNRYHHNINTSKSYYPEVCTTHTFEERLETIRLVKKHGLTLCSGVILGMGETIEQRIEMAMDLALINPDSIPVNFLSPIPKTPFESYIDKIDEENILRTLALFKIAVPNAIIRFAGGRQLRLSVENQKIALKTCVEGMMIGNFLTTIGVLPQNDIRMAFESEKNIKCMSI